MAILVSKGREVIAESLAARTMHLAWGSGDGSWITPPSESSGATALLNEIGRRLPTIVGYVVPDVAGAIVLPDGRKYTISGTPTNNLYLTFNFDYLDAPSSVIREVGVFVGGTVVSGLPGGQKYFTLAQVATPGKLLYLENYAPIFRNPSKQENFDIVITI